jgi:hypothetical protein
MIDALRNYLAGTVHRFQWNGADCFVRRLSAGEYVSLYPLMTPDADKDAGVMLAFYVQLLSLTLCDAGGNRTCGSDEARELLQRLPLSELKKLGEVALKHAGIQDDDAPKN